MSASPARHPTQHQYPAYRYLSRYTGGVPSLSDPRPVLRPPLRDVVHDRIIELIGEGSLVPGALYRDDDLASMLGVSRPTIREALVRLETNRRIAREPRSSFRVKRLTAQESLVLDRIVVSLLAISLETLRFPLPETTMAHLDLVAERCRDLDGVNLEQHFADYCAAVIDASEVPIISGMYQDRVLLPSVGQERRGVSDADRAFVEQLHFALRDEDRTRAMTIVERARGELREELLRNLEQDRSEPVAESIPSGATAKHGISPRQPILSDEVYQTMHDLIVSGEFPPGSELHDQQLSERFGTSRTPVREALNLLEAERLVVVRPQSGTTVAPISPEAVADSIQVLTATTAFIVRETASLLEDTDLDELQELITQEGGQKVTPGDQAFLLTRVADVFFERYRSTTLTGLRNRALPQLKRILAVDEVLAERFFEEWGDLPQQVLEHAQARNGEAAAQQIEDFGQRLLAVLEAPPLGRERTTRANS